MPKAPVLLRTNTEILIDRAFSRRSELVGLILLLEQDVAQIVALGAGKHSGSDPVRTITVVAASEAKDGAISYELATEAEDKARELTGDKFGILFGRFVRFMPIDGFEHVAPTHLTPAKARDLIALCRVQGKPVPAKKAYPLWPKAAK